MLYAVVCIGIVAYAFELLQRVMMSDIEGAVLKALELMANNKQPANGKKSKPPVCGEGSCGSHWLTGGLASHGHTPTTHQTDWFDLTVATY